MTVDQIVNVETVVVGFLGLWLLGTLVVTVDGWADDDYIPDSTFLGVLSPNWNFFSPRPGRWDFHLLYRDKLADGSTTEWTQVREFSETPDRYKWLWNTASHRSKLLFDIQQQLTTKFQELEEVQEMEPGDLQKLETQEHVVTTPYLLLLNYVTRDDHHEEATETQFMIMRSTELEEYEPAALFVSNYHEL